MVLVKQKSIFEVENPLPRSLLGGHSALASGLSLGAGNVRREWRREKRDDDDLDSKLMSRMSVTHMSYSLSFRLSHVIKP